MGTEAPEARVGHARGADTNTGRAEATREDMHMGTGLDRQREDIARSSTAAKAARRADSWRRTLGSEAGRAEVRHVCH